MSGSRERRRQKKIEKSRQKRAQLRKNARQRALSFVGKSLVRRASAAPFGPCWVSESLDDGEESDLISAIISRRIGGRFVAHILGIDRTCLGVKSAIITPLISEVELDEYVAEFAESGDPLRRCELLVVQSVVFHALDYARSLEFSPDEDFVPGLVGPRPDTLLDTPVARRDKPLYIAGPSDSVLGVVAQLEAKLGRGNYDFVFPPDFVEELAELDGDWEDEDEDAYDGEDDDEPANVALRKA